MQRATYGCMTNTLTIAIPAFERTEFLRAAIDSVLAQSVPADEVIVVDNGSSHGGIADIVAEYKGVSYFRNERNIGMFANWNRCLALASSDYAFILGDDDLLDPEFVTTIKACALAERAPDLIYSDYLPFSDKPEAVLWKGPMVYGSLSAMDIKVQSAKRGLFFPVISCAIKRSTFLPFYTEVHASNDWLWSVDLPESTRSIGINRQLVRYRKHGGGDSETAVNKNLFSHMCIYWLLHNKLSATDRKSSLIAALRAAKSLAVLKSSRTLAEVEQHFCRTNNVYSGIYEALNRSTLLSLTAKLLTVGTSMKRFLRRA